jgi:hypothetical protein
VFIGLLVFGIPTAAVFFCVGAFVMPLGLLFTCRRAWPTVGTWVATLIIVVLSWVGYVGYQGGRAAMDAPSTVKGTVTFDISGVATARAMGSGEATCTLFDDGMFRVDAGRGFATAAPIVSADGREVTIQMVWRDEGGVFLAISIGDRASGIGQNGSLTLGQTSTPSNGTVIVRGILPADGPEPDPADPWSGTVSWACPLG